MSTKCSIYSDGDLHIYTDCMDEEPLQPAYVDVHMTSSAGRAAIEACVPFTVLAKIAFHVNATLASVRKTAAETDGEIEKRARSDVEERSSLPVGEPGTVDRMLRSFGWGVCGNPDDPHEDQIARGVDELKRRRDGAVKALAEYEAAMNKTAGK